MAKLNEASPGHTIALKEGKKTSVKGERYDEIIVHEAAVGRRKANVYPSYETILPMRRKALPEVEQEGASKLSMAFNNIFSDHLPIFVDVEFKQPAPAPTPTSPANTEAEAPMRLVSLVANDDGKSIAPIKIDFDAAADVEIG